MLRRVRNILIGFFLSIAPVSALVTDLSRTEAEAESSSAATREVTIVVDGGYAPSRVEMKAGENVRLVFVRKEHNPCTREVVLDALGVRRELPPDEPVTIDVSSLPAGTYTFHCGMNMISGEIVVAPAT